jgi:hypothetical protein
MEAAKYTETLVSNRNITRNHNPVGLELNVSKTPIRSERHAIKWIAKPSY